MGSGSTISWCSAMADLPRMDEEQSRKAKKLIRHLCANYDGGNCLPLDDGDDCPCPQLITRTLICKYFRAAVLPANLELYGEIMGKTGMKPCAGCGQPFLPPKKNTRFCVICAANRARRSKRKWAAKNRVRRRKSKQKKP